MSSSSGGQRKRNRERAASRPLPTNASKRLRRVPAVFAGELDPYQPVADKDEKEYRVGQHYGITHQVQRLKPCHSENKSVPPALPAYNYVTKELSQGTCIPFIREAQLWMNIENHYRASEVRLDIKERSMICWDDAKRMPSHAKSYFTTTAELQRAWSYQLLFIMDAFHKRGRPFRNIILPQMLMTGEYCKATKKFLNSKRTRFSLPNQLSLLSNELMRLGNFFPEGAGILCKTPPEDLLGDLKPSPQKDLWKAALVIYELFEPHPLMRDDETDSRFAHLMRIFKFLGTPTEDTWEGVSKLPYYNQQYPQWRAPKSIELPDRVPPSVKKIVRNLLVLDPKKRQSIEDALRTAEFFIEIRKFADCDGPYRDEQQWGAKRRSLRKTGEEVKVPTEQNGAFSVSGNLHMLMAREYVPEGFCSEPNEDAENFIEEPTSSRMAVEMAPEKPKAWGVPQKEISQEKRKVLVDWLVEMCQKKQLSQDSLFLGIQILDLYMSRVPHVRLNQFQMLGEVGVFIASKMVDTRRLTLDELADIPEEYYEVREVRLIERKMLETCNIGSINIITPLYFLRSLFALVHADIEEGSVRTECLSYWLLEMALVHFSTRLYRPSVVALSAFTLALTGRHNIDHPSEALPESVRGLCADVQHADVAAAQTSGSSGHCGAAAEYKDCVKKLYDTWTSYATGPRGQNWQIVKQRKQKDSFLWDKYSGKDYKRVARIQPEDILQSISTRRAKNVVRRDPQSLLSPDIMLHLLQFFDKPEMCQMASVSKKWQLFCSQRLLSRGIWDLKRHKEVLNSESMKKLIPKLKSVETLNLFRCKLNAANIRLIFKKCESLRRLNLSYTVCDGPRDVIDLTGGIIDLTEEEKESKNRFPPLLEELNLRKSEVVEGDLKEDGLVEILDGCPNLKKLNLGMLPCVGAKTISAIINSCSNLEELSLNSCPNVTNSDLKNLSDHAKCLKRVCLDMCSKINDDGITAVAKGCPLEEFSLCADRVSDQSLYAISRFNKNLKRLELSFCYLVSTDGVVAVAKGCEKLTHLNLCLVDMIQDTAIKTLAEHCDLQELNLRGCTHITDASLESLAKNCKNLKVLHLLGCEKVSASKVAVLKERIPRVKIIIW